MAASIDLGTDGRNDGDPDQQERRQCRRSAARAEIETVKQGQQDEQYACRRLVVQHRQQQQSRQQ